MSGIYLPKERYVAALKRIRGLIQRGEKLVAHDDTTPGDKSTSCSWGLCSEEKHAWPDVEDHLFPDDFTKYGRVAPKYIRNGHPCPIDSRTAKEHKTDLNGCFHTCRVFQAKGKRPSQEQVIEWYDLRISQLNQKT